jgi:hypothetical protein
VTADDAARRDLAQAIRDLAAATMLTTKGGESLLTASELVRQAIAGLSGDARLGRYDGLPGLLPGAPTNERIWETHAAFGASNPLAPPVAVVESSDWVTGTVTFGLGRWSWHGVRRLHRRRVGWHVGTGRDKRRPPRGDEVPLRPLSPPDATAS